MTETEVPLIVDDFEEGDRVYYVLNGVTQKGTVINDEGSNEVGHISVKFDFSSCLGIPLSKFAGKSKTTHYYKGEKDNYCGRIPSLDRIEKGTVLSRLEEDGTRNYAIVMIHSPGERLLINRADKWEVFDYRTSKGVLFEDKLFDWEIEG